MSKANLIGAAGLLVGLCFTAMSCSDRQLRDSVPAERARTGVSLGTKDLTPQGATQILKSWSGGHEPPPSKLNIAVREDLDSAGSKPREGEYAMVTIPGGFVQRNGYFSATELSNPAQEKQFQTHHPVRCKDGEVFTRRDIRWYEPTVADGERCAAVIHVAICRGQQLQESATERVRSDLIALEPEKVIPRNCGPDLTGAGKEMSLLQREQLQIVLIAPGGECQINGLDPDERLQVYQSTRFGVRTFIDATLADDRRIIANNDFLRRAPEMVLGPAAYTAGERQPQFMQDGLVSQQGTNISIEQRVARSGQGYCISLTAIQGRRVWRRGFDRPSGLSPIAAHKGSRSRPPILRDAHALARALREALITKPNPRDDR